ncbi:MAG: hypothetical protein Q9217_002293 [Psora testacea]
MHDEAPVIGAGGDETVASGKERATRKWANMWRSIILSSLGKTLFPYAHYIRTLRFQDLESLLDDVTFVDKISNDFFSKELRDYRVEKSITVTKSGSKGGYKTNVVRRDTYSTLNGFAQGSNRHQHELNDNQADNQFATFLNDLRPQTLQSLEVYSTSKIGPESFLALGCHRDSLVLLHLHSIEASSMQHLSNLKACTNLESLWLENITATQDLENRYNDVFIEMVDWLCQCKNLRAIFISKFAKSPGLLAPVMKENGINIVSLVLEGYSMIGNADFHQALALQIGLRSLYLKGEGSERASDNDIFVKSLSKLVNLVDLRLNLIAEGFSEYHIRILAQNLSKLETFWTGGFGITDDIWADIASLRSLKRLEFSADTRFTANGILDFIHSLGPGNTGFALNVMMQDTDCDISEEEQSMIRDTLSSKLGGRFDFLLSRALVERLEADQKVIAHHLCYAMTATTALTAQNTQCVGGIHYVPKDFLVQQIDMVFDDIGVMLSTSGAQLLPDDAVRNLREQLFPLSTVVTPNLWKNIPEAHLLLRNAGISPSDTNSIDDLVEIAKKIQRLGPKYVLLKGGHLPLNENGRIATQDADNHLIINVLHDGEEALVFETDYITSKNTHGTGCSLAAAIASQIALSPGLAISEQVKAACQYVEMGIKTSTDWKLGKGSGPINHFHSESDPVRAIINHHLRAPNSPNLHRIRDRAKC